MLPGLRKKQTYSMIGIDLGSHSVKAIALAKSGKSYKVEGVAEMNLPRGAVTDRQLIEIDKIAQVIKQVKRNFPAKYKYAAAAVSGADVYTKVVQMDAELNEMELEAQIELEAEHLIPFPIDEISIDFEVLGINVTDPSRNDVLISAARTDTIVTKTSCLEDAGMEPKVIDIESHVLARSCQLVLEDEDFDKVVAAIDVGASMMTFAMMNKGESIYSRAQNYGGHNYTQAIASFYNMDLDKAEKDKLANTLPEDYDTDVMAPFVTSAIQHIRRNIQLFCSSSGYSQVDKIVLTGGGSLLPELVAQIESELEIPLVHANPFTGFKFSKDADGKLLSVSGSKFMMSLGLAMRSFTPCQI
ncbi:pilus assembly protein PilM [Motilimonas pumila]|uniref:Pilus assembly protein PilM n=2 Tax=Motilimonas pumila TaxID=2303987 RepID=A0A418YCX4_9GAMM|nr:pilus assembly protein PilM [Motilimonas pumila]